jgi:ferritin
MAINSDVQDALNDQIRNELHSFYRYLSAAAYFETATPYGGFASWMRLQATEEQEHAMKLFDYLIDRGGQVQLQTLPAPESEFGSPLQAFQQSLSWEEEVTAQINNLYRVAHDANDFATMNFLGWFLDEQVEEEKTTGDLVDRLELAGDDTVALLRLDAEAGARKADEEDEA